MTTDNRTNEITEEQVEAAAKAMWDLRKTKSDPEWGALEYGVKQEYRKDARAALVAAQGAAPQEHPTMEEIGEDIARGIRDSLSGVAPQVPNQNETKSGNNFVSLDPEKVAEVLLANAKSRYGGLLFEERAAARIAHALCEAYTEGRLTK